MSELFETIPDYPAYAVSTHGIVINQETGKELSANLNPQGDLKVGLYRDGSRATVAIRVLVAEAFVEPPNIDCDTVIVLNGDKEDIRASNLAWRPRSFAWKYAHQFQAPPETLSQNLTRVPVMDVDSGRVYQNVYTAAMEEGLLMNHVLSSCFYGTPVYPTDQVFEYTEEGVPNYESIHGRPYDSYSRPFR